LKLETERSVHNLKIFELLLFAEKFAKMTENKNDKAKIDLGLLEEDDEFEEFPAEGMEIDEYR